MESLEQSAEVIPSTEIVVEVPTVKKVSKKKSRMRSRRRRSRYRDRTSQAERDWQTWNHDFDTMLHQLVKNKEVNKLAPKTIVKRAEQFADAMLETQNRRRPEGVKSSGRW
jgi:hypothetical protein